MQERLKRMRMRAWRRGMKEMDIVLGPYADARLEQMEPAELEAFEMILSENDQDLMAWILGQKATPAAHSDMISRLRAFAEARNGKV